MIIREYITIDGNQFIRNYSDEGRFVVRDGVAYGEAIDPMPWAEERFYEEGDIMPVEETPEEEPFEDN